MSGAPGASFSYVVLVVGASRSGKTTILQRVREATREPSVGKKFGFYGPWRPLGGVEENQREDEEIASGTHEVTAVFRCADPNAEGPGQEGEGDELGEDGAEKPVTEAEATVCLHEVSATSGSLDPTSSYTSPLAHLAEVRRAAECARCAIVVFDVTSASSYLTARELCSTLRGSGDNETELAIAMLGNRNFTPPGDGLAPGRAVATVTAADFAEEHGALYFEVDALGGQNVVESVNETLCLAQEPLLPRNQAAGARRNGRRRGVAGGVMGERLERMNIVATSRVK